MRSSDDAMLDVYVCLSDPGDHLAPKGTPTMPSAVLAARLPGQAAGENGLFVRPGDIVVGALLAPGRKPDPVRAFAYDFLYFSESQRAVRARSMAILQERLDAVLGPAARAPGATASDLVPFVIAVVRDGVASLYHFADLSFQGALYLAYDRVVAPKGDLGCAEVEDLVRKAYPRLQLCRELLNDNCGFSRWQAAFELERKFTFSQIPDTWRLTQDLYKLVQGGSVAGFVPEIGLEFQVYDYESHIFEVTDPPEEAGYISFIPQYDGKMTLKRKWFVENAELRRETIVNHQNVAFDDIERHVATVTAGRTVRLPAFRRKRFDVHLESLGTGHVFGIYFDICRIVGDDSYAMSQCEVEYCRSRTLFDLKEVHGEFEALCAFTKNFISSRNLDAEHNLYSKLDFVRDYFLAVTA